MKSNRRQFRKLFILFAIIFITSVVLIYETYAWFVGLSSVSVDQFTVSVAAGEGLELSLDGSNWSSNSISIDPTTIESIYSGNTNKWPSNGLSPVSTNGLIDSSSSKLNLYQKSSLSATAGGYQISSTKIDNSTVEQEGYIAFDLFVRNKGNGTYSYPSTYDGSQDEDIYLTANSNAYVPTSGSVNYGLANSIRVGFFELGRTTSSALGSPLGHLKCSNTPNLCATSEQLEARRSYTWNIWEPNAGKHASDLVNYFNQICKVRSGATTYSNDSCFPLEVGSSRKTYALNSATTSSDGVDVYDGADLNEYTSSSKITEMKTYKTSYATSSGSDKPPLLRIAGDSITKVRVYIWLEGQDIDNYDIVTWDSQVNINFGFTKDRFGLNDENVNNPTTGRASSFEDDSWKEIQTNIRNNNTSQYKVGDTRELKIGNNTYTLRIANKTSPSDICSGSTNSQTACGFVVEFVDIVEKRAMNSSDVSGWPLTELYTYLQGDFYNSLPNDLKEVIAKTRVVSGGSSGNYTTNDKLYFLSLKELSGLNSTSDTSSSQTRRLDYYATKNMLCGGGGHCKITEAKKRYNDEFNSYYTRMVDASRHSVVIDSTGLINNYSGIRMVNVVGFAPVFRIA